MTVVAFPADTRRELLASYHERGFKLVFWPNTLGKGPRDAGWPLADFDIADWHEGLNVGIKTGVEISPGRFLCDVDFDWTVGQGMAKFLLPATSFVFGHKEKLVSHAFYTTSSPVPTIVYKNLDGKPFVELRGAKQDGTVGFQSMCPPSTHPNGSLLELSGGDSTIGHDDDLPRRVMLYAIACALLHHLGHLGLVNDVRLAVAGFLLRLGLSEPEVIAIGEAVAFESGNKVADVAAAVRSTATKLRNGTRGVTGGPALAKAIGERGIDVVRRIREWVPDTVLGDDRFECDKKGKVFANDQVNIKRAWELLGVTLFHNTFAEKMLLSYEGVTRPIDDAMVDRIRFEIDTRFHFRPEHGDFRRLMFDTARKNPFHPVRDYLSGLTWDRQPRIDTWLTTYGGARDTKLCRAFSALTLLAAVKRVRYPGCKKDELLVIISAKQGTNKSASLRALCPKDEWFSDDLPLSVDSQEIIERTLGKWIIEISDLQGFGNRKIEQLKASLSRQVDGPVRMAYAHIPVEVPRQHLAIGTTNQKRFLKDQTGNRRFWTVEIDEFNVAALERDRDQLWAEAAYREAEGESIRLDKALWGDAGKEQMARLIDDAWAETLREFLHLESPEPEQPQLDPYEPADRMPLDAIWDALGVPLERRTPTASERLCNTMQALGYEKKRAKGLKDMDDAKHTKWRWCRLETEAAGGD